MKRRRFSEEAQRERQLRAAFKNAGKTVRKSLIPILPPGEIEFAGIRMYVDPRDNYTERRMWANGEPPEMESLRALVELIEDKKALVLDVGANCGAFTIPLAFAAGDGSRVIAFEPNPIMIGRLGHNVRLNNLGHVVRIEGCALGAEAGEAMLNFQRGNFGQASLLPIGRARMDAGQTLVPLRRLTDFTENAADYEVTILKIDVEGAEEQALAPLLAQDNTWKPDAILIETMHADLWSTDLLGALKDMSYAAVFEADGNTLLQKS